MAERIRVGDILVCYMVKMSRWVGVMKVVEGPFIDRTPVFVEDDDPFIVRFKVDPEVWLPLDKTIPIHDQSVFNHLSFTKDVKAGGYWLGPLRRSLQSLREEDGAYLVSLLKTQMREQKSFELDEELYRKSLKRRIQRHDGSVAVSVPDDREEEIDSGSLVTSGRESIEIQALLCGVGEAMGLHVWLPIADRTRVLEHWSPAEGVLLDRLPLNYDETTLETIKRIDVLWLKGRTITRAFEVEHTTAIYSGLLRMADLCALLPNINVALNIVAPESRRDKVFQEITRPVFSLLEEAPLFERCTYLSYNSVRELARLEYLSHTTDSVLDEFVEYAE